MRLLKMMNWARLREGGLTLVEILIALALTGIAFASVGFMLASGFWMSADGRGYLYASNALRGEQEALRGMSFDTLAGLAGNSTFSNAQIVKLPSGAGSRVVEDAAGPDIKRVTLTVSWAGRSGRTISQGVTTHVSRSGINGG
ncbi:MAG: PulJ/GspJ family protein [Candidatus Omnitrophota bacterium]